jgi:hypothetical protein
VAGLQLPMDFGSPAACIRSPNDRIVVASSDGLVDIFEKDRDAVIAVDSYRAAPDVADLRLDGDRLIVGTRSGARVQWPFFDSLGAVIRFSLDQLPFEGGSRVTMPKDVSCRINDRESGCVPESVPTFDGTALSASE